MKLTPDVPATHISQEMSVGPKETYHIRPKSPLETGGHYARRKVDPIQVALAIPEERAEIADMSEAAMHGALIGHNNLELIELGTDIIYRRFGIVDPAAIRQQCEETRTLVIAEKDKRSKDPLVALSLGMRQLDIEAMSNISRSADADAKVASSANVSESEKRKRLAMLDKLYEVKAKQVIKNGTELLTEAKQSYDSAADNETKTRLCGKMFELFSATYLRHKIYEADEKDKAVVVGSTNFEDDSARCFEPEFHNYDLLVLDSDGNVKAIYQCKSGANTEAYKKPIEKINGKAFNKFMENPVAYISALAVLVENSPFVSEDAMKRNLSLLEQLFSVAVNPVGATALAGTSS